MAWGVPARVLADQLTADDLIGYEAWYHLEPYGGRPADIRTAIIAHTTAASMAKNAPSLDKFIPKWDTPPRLSAKQTQEAVKAWAASVNAKTR